MDRKTLGLFVLLCVAAFLARGLCTAARSQESQAPAASGSQPEAVVDLPLSGTGAPAQVGAGEQSMRETWYQFFEKGRPISDIIALVFLVGVIFVVDEVRRIFFDSLRSMRLRRMDLQKAGFEEISKEIARRPNTLIARLLGSLISSYHTTGSLEGINLEINFFIQSLQDQFNSFRSRLDLLSDSAGALGLLGTVWGIFITFEVENWTQDTVLRGMGLALVTTFIGIIVSLVLNLLSTEVFNYFNRRNDRLQEKFVEFRKNLYRRHVELRVNGEGLDRPARGGDLP
jgi:biopolymer transport protein ExbB/TolQ